MRLLRWLAATGMLCGLSAADFSARLDTRLSSYRSHEGDEFRATVIDPAVDAGKILIPEGSELMGRVVRARSVGVGLVRERAELNVEIYAYRLPDGAVIPCSAQVRRIDNSRETTTSDGRIRGILAAGGPAGLPRGLWRMPNQAMLERPATRLAGYSFGAGGLVPMISLGLLAVRWTAFRFPEPEIDLPPGTEMTIALTSRAPDAPEFEAEPVKVACSRLWERMARDVHRPNGERADDVINIVMSGTSEQVRAAFTAAGWLPADPLSKTTFLRMYKAWTSMRGYPTAPVSRLYYKGREPDMVFQKSLNTVARRHHIRIWQVAGRDLWIGAATHDVSIGFEVQKFSLTHRIDPNLDTERTKVYTDLRGSGCLEEAGMINVSLPEDESRPIESDGRMLRLGLKDCSGPSATPSVLFANNKPGNPVTRMTRRFALETKQYIFRDNYIYWGYRAVRAGSQKLTAARRRSAARDVELAKQTPVSSTQSQRGM